ncbi:hypothetical protein FQN55_001814 [Onygenales sp. PD_40]|nr:hypothetical protein FQN55_001814 [Onygenales sp. PD_40]KAK2779837.1 hypothetical protein FQN53_001267 [Emmonsiellopsis sp. PD_33]KAK2790525.1 hypothetical protein FQN52_005542 [Onygenales sp. PD_12]KAK2800106.1 hypothetical protein FQN51_006347 [Onygenales sp. PD_10]
MPSIALITGGAGDIGRAIATRLAESHDLVVLVDIDEAKAQDVTATLNKTNSQDNPADQPAKKFTYFICDITSPTQVSELASKVSLLPGTLQTLINNAGATWTDSLHQMTPDLWKRETSLNIDAAFYIFHAFADTLKHTHGNLVNIASLNGLSVFGNPAYSAAKAGLIHLTRSIAVEYARFGVRANAVAPGTVKTHAWEERVRAHPDVFEDVMRLYPLKRTIEPGDVANAVAFLSSDVLAGAITGVCLPVDAGLMAGQTAVARAVTQCEDY